MSKHTPAPWHVGVHEDTNELGIVGPKYGIASIFCQRGLTVPIPVAEAMANARLMSAAPDLLAACIAMRRTMYSADSEESKLADAAIAKATGGESRP